MTLQGSAILFVAAAVGGALNSVAGGGSFVAFPALIFAGTPPVLANTTTSVALWPGSVASAFAYRRELAQPRLTLAVLSLASLAGGIGGAFLLLGTSDTTFVRLLPWLMLLASSLFTFGGKVAAKLRGRAQVGLAVAAIVQLLISLYGGYFGGGMGIMMLAAFSVMGMTDIHAMNALKTVLATLINGIAITLFIAAGKVSWGPGVVMLAGATLGGYGGAAVARRMNPLWVRRLVMVVAWSMTAYFFVRRR